MSSKHSVYHDNLDTACRAAVQELGQVFRQGTFGSCSMQGIAWWHCATDSHAWYDHIIRAMLDAYMIPDRAIKKEAS